VTRPGQPLVFDRDRELTRLSSLAAGSRGAFALIEGPAGIGKTTLLHKAREAHGTALVLRARGGELERQFAFGVVRQAFEPVLRDAELRERCLTGAASLAARALGLEHTGTAGDLGQSLHGLYWACSNLADEQPLFITVDDLQWSDEESLRWLHFLARRVKDLPVTLVGAVRIGEPHAPEELLELLRSEADEIILPGPLTDSSTAAWIEATLGSHPSPRFTSACHEITGGNPFYLSEVLEAARTSGLTPDDRSAEALSALGPRRIANGIAARVARCGPDAVTFTRALATLGIDPPIAIVAELGNLSSQHASGIAKQLAELAILRRPPHLDFIHPVVRSAVETGIPADERYRLHARSAQLLDARGEPADRVAAHLLQTLPSGDPHVIDVLRRAGAEALRLGAVERAERMLRRALEEPPEDEVKGAVLGELAFVVLAHDLWESCRLRLEALRYLRDPAARGETLSELLVIYSQVEPEVSAESRAEVIDLLRRSLAELDGKPKDVVLALELDLLHWEGYRRGHRADRAEELFAKIDELPVTWRTLSLRDARGVASHWGRREATAAQVAEDYRVYFAHEAASPKGLADLGLISVMRLCDCDRSDLAEEILAWCRELLATRGLSGARGPITVTEAVIAMQGRGQARRAEELLAAVGDDPLFEADFFVRNGFKAWVAIERDRLEAAAAELGGLGVPLQGALHPQEDGGSPALFHLVNRGLLRLAADEAEAALADLLAAGEATRKIGMVHAGAACWRWRTPAAIALARLERRDEALKLAEETLDLSYRWGTATTVGRSLVALGVALGPRTGLDRIREGVRVLEDSPNLAERVRGLLELGTELRLAGQRTDARALLRSAARIADGAGLELAARRSREQLHAAGGRARRSDVNRNSLSPIEERIAALVIENRSNRQIAESLFLSRRTVDAHLTRILRKLSIRSRRDVAGALGMTSVAEDGTSTVMFTDIVGSTILNRTVGDQAWLPILARHNAIVREQVLKTRGVVVKSIGDGFMLAFRQPAAAAQCAVAIQRTLADAQLPDRRVRVRIGLHHGRPQQIDGDLHGADINLAARICKRAAADEVLCSAATAEKLAATDGLVVLPAPASELRDFGTVPLFYIQSRDQGALAA